MPKHFLIQLVTNTPSRFSFRAKVPLGFSARAILAMIIESILLITMRTLPQTRELDAWLVQARFAGQQTALPVRQNFADRALCSTRQFLA